MGIGWCTIAQMMEGYVSSRWSKKSNGDSYMVFSSYLGTSTNYEELPDTMLMYEGHFGLF